MRPFLKCLLCLALVLGALFATHLPGQAQANNGLPPTYYALNLKGVLVDSSSNPLPDGTYSVQFRLYKVISGPDAPAFTEDQTVSVFTKSAVVPTQSDRKGNYAVSLGRKTQTTPLRSSLFVNQTLYLEIWINGVKMPGLRLPILQIPADSRTGQSMSQVIWVTNALNRIEANRALETAALAFYIQQVYKLLPTADPNFVTRSLIRAQNSFNQRYRSPQSGGYRFVTQPLDAIINMYGILVQQPGNPVTLPIVNESIAFAAGTLDLTQGNASDQYKQFSYELGRMASGATFNDYTSSQLEALYLLARQNKSAARVVDAFFGYELNARVTDPIFTLLNKNPDLRDSPNFAPLVSQIESDGTMLSTVDTTLANIGDFYDRMTMATKTLTNALNQVTFIQQTDYAGSLGAPSATAQIATISNNAFATLNGAKTLTALNASAYTNQIVLKSDAAYKAYQIAATSVRLAAGVAITAGDTLDSAAKFMKAASVEDVLFGISAADVASGTGAASKAVGDALNVTATSLDLAANAGAFDPSPQGVIKDGIKQIGSQLAAIQNQIDQRAAITDAHIVDLYNQMNTNFHTLELSLELSFSNITTALTALTTDVLNIQYTLDRLAQSFSTFATQSQRAANLVPYLTQINNWSNPGQPKPGSDAFNTAFGACQTYATSTALTFAETNWPLSTPKFDDQSVLSQLDGDPQKNLNYLLAFASHRFYARENGADSIFIPPYNDPLTLLNGSSLANPTAWEMASLGIMRAAADFPDLGQPFIQAAHSAFDAAYKVGDNLQRAATNVTVESASNGIQKSPILFDMLLHQNLMASNLFKEIQRAEANGYSVADPAPAPDVASRVAYINAHLSDPNSQLSKLALALDGSHRLLEQFCEFGLSRSVKSVDLLSSMLYAAGNTSFRDLGGNLAADPNAQKLPDGNWVRSLYHNWVTAIPAAPNPPAAAAQNNSSSTLTGGSYYVRISYTVSPAPGASGESQISSVIGPVTITDKRVGTPQRLVITPPILPTGASRWKAYVGTNANGPFSLQNGNGTAAGASVTISAPIVTAVRYSAYVTADPKTLFHDAQNTRWTTLDQVVNGHRWYGFDNSGNKISLADVITTPAAAGDARSLLTQAGLLDIESADAQRNGLLLGEPLGNVEAIQNRLAFFLIPTVTGTVKGARIPNLPDTMQPKSLANTPITLTFNGATNQFSAPVLLDSSSRFTVYIPKDTYTAFAVADSFLQNKIQAPGQVFGYVDTTSGSVLNAIAFLTVGDVTGHNRVDNQDAIALRNAFNSVSSDGSWRLVADFNGDGIVDGLDQALLQSAIGTTTGSSNWNPTYDLNGDGSVTSSDLTILRNVMGTAWYGRGWNPKADLNGDGSVDIYDESLLLAALGSVPGNANWNAKADLNNDGKVDLIDLSLLQAALGTRISSLAWNPKFDLNGDGTVDYRDQILLQGALGSDKTSPRWNPAADLNGDGKVDSSDQSILFVALGSLKSDPANGGNPSANWNAKADLNGDGVVDYRDQEVLQGKIGTTPASLNWDPTFDLNGDGKVDATDIALMTAAQGARVTSANWNPLADLNGDGVVDMLDYKMLLSSFGKQGQQR